MLLLAHVSDIHVDAGDRRVERARRVFDYLNNLPGELDAVLLSGDLADNGLAGEYEQVAKVITGRHRVLHLPGNHDARGPYREVLLGEAGNEAPINRVERVGDVVVALVDSTVPGHDEGYVADESLDWLSGVLADAAGTPVLVSFHHPPVELHMWVDRIRQRGEQRLAELIHCHPNVVGVLCGHAHTPAATTFAGRPLLVAPGVVSTCVLPWEQGGEVTVDLPPAVAFHVLDDELRLTTHYRVVP